MRLKKDPLLEAAWELRFAGDPAIGAALLGTSLEKLRATGRAARLELLPLASVPAALRNTQEQLRHGATHALRGEGYTILTGDDVVALSVVRPYPGWSNFKARILELAAWIKDTGIIPQPLGFSIRYIDFFPGPTKETLKLLAINIQIGGLVPESGELHLQLPACSQGFQGLIQILNPAQVAAGGAHGSTGLITDVLITDDAASLPDPWKCFEERLDQAKVICHRLFFSLLKPDTIQSMDPVYED